ncbi:MAG TPA: glycosyltransferase family 2 protein [Candidatus Binataceae bacterium]|jgi:glycosyltransferase involved in cell wall biosynthesis|nr:glycosyltransferase family 2 protein [Candidatus Binataceae bacterium]
MSRENHVVAPPKLPLTVLVLTYNEERNLRAALDSVADWAQAVWVVDSISTDRTREIALESGAGFVQHPFETHAAQKNWALDNLPISTEWVLFLDADERVSVELREEIRSLLSATRAPCNGYYIAMINHFMGEPLYHGAWHPDWRLLLFRRNRGRFEERAVHEHLMVEPPLARLKHYLIHDDRKGLERYFDRHNIYSTMEAFEGLRERSGRSADGMLSARPLGTAPERRRWLKRLAYRYAIGRPLLRFGYSYFWKRGFLDGRVGFRYCVLQMFYDYQVSLKMMELQRDPASPMHARLKGPASSDPAKVLADVAKATDAGQRSGEALG